MIEDMVQLFLPQAVNFGTIILIFKSDFSLLCMMRPSNKRGIFFMQFIKEFFKLDKRKTNIQTELLAGLTTFLAMAYILPVNADMLSGAGVPFGGVFFATAVAAAVASIIMGLYANYPVALAPGMGLNAFFAFTLVGEYELSWQASLTAVFVSGILFLIVSVSGLRKTIINAIPKSLKFAVGAGIGFFITFIGLKNAGIIVGDVKTFVTLGDLSHPAVLLAIFGIILVFILYALKVKFALIITIVATAILGLILNGVGVDYMPSYSSQGVENLWSEVGDTIGQGFTGFGELFSHPELIIILFTLLFVDFFDTSGTLMAVGHESGLMDENGELVDSGKALVSDSVGTIFGAVLGTSTVTSYIESATGIEQGGRTGLTAVSVGVLFILSIAIYPLLSVVNGIPVGLDAYGDLIFYSPVTAMALVLVGALMVKQLKDIEWNDTPVLIASFLTIIMMVLTYSIATGIAIGFIFYPLAMIASKRYKEVHPMMYGLAVVFIISMILGAI
jgi:AGZA family xanthine/uracil permease-like MFS transporter